MRRNVRRLTREVHGGTKPAAPTQSPASVPPRMHLHSRLMAPHPPARVLGSSFNVRTTRIPAASPPASCMEGVSGNLSGVLPSNPAFSEDSVAANPQGRGFPHVQVDRAEGKGVGLVNHEAGKGSTREKGGMRKKGRPRKATGLAGELAISILASPKWGLLFLTLHPVVVGMSPSMTIGDCMHYLSM